MSLSNMGKCVCVCVCVCVFEREREMLLMHSTDYLGHV